MRTSFVGIALVALAGCSSELRLRRVLLPPEVALVVPQAGQVFRQQEPVVEFSGVVSDSFDGPDRLVVTWQLDEEAPVSGTVREDGTTVLDIDTLALAQGEHSVALTVVDRDDLSATAEAMWLLQGALEAPRVEITKPLDGAVFEAGTEIVFQGEASDNNTDPDDLTLLWTSSVDGPLPGAISDAGQSVLFSDSLSTGTHIIAFLATDLDGELGADTITIEVVETSPTTPTPGSTPTTPGTTPTLGTTPTVSTTSTVGATTTVGTLPTETTTTTEPGTETVVIGVGQVGDLVFSEFLANPSVVTDEEGEFIELYSTASSPIDLDGYVLSDHDIDSFELVGTLVVEPGEYVVLCANVDPLTNGGLPCDAEFNRSTFGGAGAYALANTGDELVLLDPYGTVIDEVVYTSSWVSTAVSVAVDPDFLNSVDNDTLANWCDQTSVTTAGGEPSTPGQPNDPC